MRADRKLFEAGLWGCDYVLLELLVPPLSATLSPARPSEEQTMHLDGKPRSSLQSIRRYTADLLGPFGLTVDCLSSPWRASTGGV
jgi:hypothetical protein